MATEHRPRVTLFGDSVFAGYGLAPGDAPAAQLAELLPAVAVTAAGVPDQTSADGLARVDTIEGDLVLVEFGLNDAIAGVPRERIVANLRAIVGRLGARAMLVEALVPTDSRWPAITDLTGIAEQADGGSGWLPDILAGLADDGLVQADGLQPNAAGARRVTQRLIAATHGRLERAQDDVINTERRYVESALSLREA